MTRFPALLLCAALLLAACDTPTQAQNGAASAQAAPQRARPQAPTQTDRAPTDDPVSGLREVRRTALPREGQALLNVIERGGPFEYTKDGSVFGNREGLLPRHTRGYYREYTVPTPGENDRGARRIVCGGQPETRTAECYYTADHYASFRKIRP